jgi:hypothetical protein
MRSGAILSAAYVIAVAVYVFASALAMAQEADTSAAMPPAVEDEAAQPPPAPLTPEESATLGNALLFDPATAADGKPVKALRLPTLSDPDQFNVSQNGKPDGSSTLVVKKPLASEWGATVGADLNFTAQADGTEPSKPLPLIADEQGSGAAWATVGVPNFASLDARVDPGNDQGKLGTTFKHSIPVGGKFSVTLQNSYSVTENFYPPAAAPSDVPLMAAPVASAPTPQVWGSEKAVKFDILTTGTTFGAGVTTASNDPVTHNTLSADQTLYGPLHVTTAVTDLGQTTASKSISARFKLNW